MLVEWRSNNKAIKLNQGVHLDMLFQESGKKFAVFDHSLQMKR